jgi:hypothetical protein
MSYYNSWGRFTVPYSNGLNIMTNIHQRLKKTWATYVYICVPNVLIPVLKERPVTYSQVTANITAFRRLWRKRIYCFYWIISTKGKYTADAAKDKRRGFGCGRHIYNPVWREYSISNFLTRKGTSIAYFSILSQVCNETGYIGARISEKQLHTEQY